MKKLLIALGALLAVGLAGVLVWLFAFAPDDVSLLPQDSSSSDSAQQEQTALGVYTSNVRTDADIMEALDRATQRNRDTVGWLRIPNTEVNNCVLQSFDNSTYLRTNENREYDIYGCYFVDYECVVGDRRDLSDNTVIYGHSDMQDNANGKRFSQLYHYTDPEFAANNPVITFSTLDSFMEWQVFAVFYTDRSFNYIDAWPEDGPDGLAARVAPKSLYDFGVTVGPDDHILTLSTCSARYGASNKEQRFVIMAKLLDEDAEVPATVAVTEKTPQE